MAGLPLLLRLAHLARTAPAHAVEMEFVRRTTVEFPLYLGAELLVLTLLGYAVLHWAIGRPLADTERSISQLERLDLELSMPHSGGPVLTRIQQSLRRTADALRVERELTRRQLADVQRMNAKLTTAYTELASSERLAMVGKLAAGVAHEIGNPLSGILGYLSLIRSPSRQGSELAEYVERVEAEVSRISRIVRGLLDLGGPARGQRGPVQVRALADTCIGLVEKGPDFAQVRVEQRIAPEAVASAEAGPLSQILINLLLNAAQAMGGKGTIVLRSRAEPPRLVIDVEDTGPGIPSEFLARVFEPFFTTKAAGVGTGLGLAVSQSLARQLGGELVVENLTTGGARFSISLEIV